GGVGVVDGTVAAAISQSDLRGRADCGGSSQWPDAREGAVVSTADRSTGGPGNENNGHVHVSVYDDLDGVAHAAANLLVQLQAADRPQEHFNIALSGGSTPRALHRVLVTPPYRERVDWESMQYFWGDVFFVATAATESNYRM